MKAIFEHLPQDGRVWIYQSDKPLAGDLAGHVLSAAKTFAESWSSHGTSLKAGAEIIYERFLILYLDESVAGASGCSIDKSVHFIKELETQFGIGLLSRSDIAYLKGENLHFADLKELKKLASEKVIVPETLVFDNTVSTTRQLVTSWQIPAANTWLKKYFHSAS